MIKKENIKDLFARFEDVAKRENNITYWSARELQKLLDYARWETFETAIERAKQAVLASGFDVNDHFRELTKMVAIGSGSQREITDVLLTRYACYVIAQNGDPKKETIAFAQTYFALQTRKQEIIEERLQLSERMAARAKLSETEKKMSGVLYEHAIDSKGFALIRSQGDAALFGGHATKAIKEKMGIPPARALADFLPAVLLKAKEFAAAITTHNTRDKSLTGVNQISAEHIKNNKDIRNVLVKNDIVPESLPPEEDIKKLERRVNRELKPKKLEKSEK